MSAETLSSKDSDRTHRWGQPSEIIARWKRYGRVLLRWSLVVLLVLLVINIGLSVWSKTALRRAEEQVADSGESLDFRDYIPPEIPNLENASIYLEAMGALHPVLIKEPWPPGSTEAGGPTLKTKLFDTLGRLDKDCAVPGEDDLVLFRTALQRFDLQYELFDRARQLEKARFNTHYSSNLPITNEVPRIFSRLEMANLLAARALLAMGEGRPEDAYRDAAGILRLAGWAAMEAPALFTKRLAVYMIRTACRTVNQLMLVSPPGPAAEAMIMEEADRFDAGPMFRRGMLYERAANYSTLVDPDFESSPYRPYDRLSAAKYLVGMSLAIEEAEPPAYRRDPGLMDDEVQVERYAPGFFGLMARMMMDNCQSAGHRRDELVARLDLLSLAFRLEEYRRGTGAYPERLDMLEGPQPIDPFSGEAYRYRPADGGGYLLYSISGNRMDDGGIRAQKPWQTWRSGDLVWRMR